MKKILKINTDKLFTDITDEISKQARSWGKSGIVNIFSKHTTFCIWCGENEILHKVDVRFFLDKIKCAQSLHRVNSGNFNLFI